MATLKPTTVPAKRLAETISGASTTFKLNNIRSWAATATDLTSADFGDRLWAVFRNSAGTLMEIMEVDPTTITSASSPITIILRGLKFDGDDVTEVSANKLTWVKGDTVVELGTHVPQLLYQYVDRVADQTIAGVKTFSSLPITTAGNPVLANELARKAYVDSVVAGIATSVSNVVPGTAGETLVEGNLIYLKLADNRWWKTDADDAATVNNVLLGIAQGGGTAGNLITNGVMTRGVDTNQSGMTGGNVMYASNTAGSISSSVGTIEVTVGVAKSATELYFDPRFNQQITENEQDALVGNNGTPGATNTFVTQAGLQRGTEKYAADSGANDTYVITLSPVPASYVEGMVVHFKANTANTGAATLNVNSLGAITIVKGVSTTLSDGDILAGQYCTVIYNGTNFVLQNPVALNSSVSSIPKVHISTAFETAARFTTALTGSGAGSYGTSGRTQSTGGGVSGSSNLTMNLVLAPYLGSPTFACNVTYSDPGGGSNFTTFFGIGDLTVATAGITFTGRHIGFKTVGLNLIATQADGTTETASSTLTTITSGDNIDLAFKVNGTSSVDYYWRKAGGTWSSATNLTTNIPSGTTTTLQMATSSNNSANGLTITCPGWVYER